MEILVRVLSLRIAGIGLILVDATARFFLANRQANDPTKPAGDVFKTKDLSSLYVIDCTAKVRLARVGAIKAINLDKFDTFIIKEQ